MGATENLLTIGSTGVARFSAGLVDITKSHLLRFTTFLLISDAALLKISNPASRVAKSWHPSSFTSARTALQRTPHRSASCKRAEQFIRKASPSTARRIEGECIGCPQTVCRCAQRSPRSGGLAGKAKIGGELLFCFVWAWSLDARYSGRRSGCRRGRRITFAELECQHHIRG